MLQVYLPQNFTPALHLVAGKKYTITTSTVGNISQEVMGQKMEIKMNTSVYNTLEIKTASDNDYQLLNTNDRVTSQSSAMGQDINYDSDKKEDREGAIGEGFKSFIGSYSSFKVNSYGKLVEGSIVNQIPQKILIQVLQIKLKA